MKDKRRNQYKYELRRFGINLIISAMWRLVVGFLSYFVLLERGAYKITEGNSFWPFAGAVRWDSFWYLRIANNGYNSIDPNWLSSDPNFAFFPLYPLLLRFTHILTGLDMTNCGVILNIIFVALALYIIEKIVTVYNVKFNQKFKPSVIKILVLFSPVAVFFGMIYTEALFLFLFSWFLYGLISRTYQHVFIAGALISVTKLYGIFLLLVGLIYCWWYTSKQAACPGTQKTTHLSTGNILEQIRKNLIHNIKLVLASILSFMPFLGWLFFNYNYKSNHNPLFFIQAQKWWWQRVGFHFNVLSNLVDGFKTSVLPIFTNPTKFNGDGWQLQLFKDNVAVIISYFLLAIGYKKIPLSWWIVTVAILVSSSISLNFMSVSRYVLPLIPLIFIIEYYALKYRLELWLIAVTVSLFSLQVVLSALGSRVGV